MKIRNFEVIFQQLPEGGVKVVIPALPEIKLSGKTLKEAKALANEAIEKYIDVIKADEPVLTDANRRLMEDTLERMRRGVQNGTLH